MEKDNGEKQLAENRKVSIQLAAIGRMLTWVAIMRLAKSCHGMRHCSRRSGKMLFSNHHHG
jgi:hypothetical protein